MGRGQPQGEGCPRGTQWAPWYCSGNSKAASAPGCASSTAWPSTPPSLSLSFPTCRRGDSCLHGGRGCWSVAWGCWASSWVRFHRWWSQEGQPHAVPGFPQSWPPLWAAHEQTGGGKTFPSRAAPGASSQEGDRYSWDLAFPRAPKSPRGAKAGVSSLGGVFQTLRACRCRREGRGWRPDVGSGPSIPEAPKPSPDREHRGPRGQSGGPLAEPTPAWWRPDGRPGWSGGLGWSLLFP